MLQVDALVSAIAMAVEISDLLLIEILRCFTLFTFLFFYREFMKSNQQVGLIPESAINTITNLIRDNPVVHYESEDEEDNDSEIDEEEEEADEDEYDSEMPAKDELSMYSEMPAKDELRMNDDMSSSNQPRAIFDGLTKSFPGLLSRFTNPDNLDKTKFNQQFTVMVAVNPKNDEVWDTASYTATAEATINLVLSDYPLANGDNTDFFYAKEEKDYIAKLREIANNIQVQETKEAVPIVLPVSVSSLNVLHLQSPEVQELMKRTIEIMEPMRSRTFAAAAMIAQEPVEPAHIDRTYEDFYELVCGDTPNSEAPIAMSIPRTKSKNVRRSYSAAEMKHLIYLRTVAFDVRKRANPSYTLDTSSVDNTVDDMVNAILDYSDPRDTKAKRAGDSNEAHDVQSSDANIGDDS